MTEEKSGWGGRRKNQTGRPKQDRVRAQHQIRAYPEEWEIIRAFAAIVKKDPERAARMMEIQ